MTESEKALMEWFLNEMTLLEVFADCLIEDFKNAGETYREACERAERFNQLDKALSLGSWHDAMQYSEKQAGHMKRHLNNLEDKVETRLPVRPKLQLVVDNKKAPAATDAHP